MNAGVVILLNAVRGWYIYPPDFRVVRVKSAFCILIGWESGGTVSAVGAKRSGDAPLGHSCLTCWFQAAVLEAANSYWPLTSAGLLSWNWGELNFDWLLA